MRVVGTLTLHLSPSQTSPGKDLSNGSSRACVSHNASNTGSSKLLQQHAKASVVARSPDATSSQTISLRISSTLRHGCIELKRRVNSHIGGAGNFVNSRVMQMCGRLVRSNCRHRLWWWANGQLTRAAVLRRTAPMPSPQVPALLLRHHPPGREETVGFLQELYSKSLKH
jgi:hypothetical protein